MESNPSFSVDSMIYDALASVDLQNIYFSSYNNPKSDEIDNLRSEYRLARFTVLSKRVGFWSYKTTTLTLDDANKLGWYQAPADLIAWVDPRPFSTSTNAAGKRIYQLSSATITYIFDPQDLNGFPIEIITSIRDFFLLRLTPRAKISAPKMDQIRAMAIKSDENAKEFCSINNQSRERIRHGY